MSKLRLKDVEEILEGDESYSTIVDCLRLIQKYGKAKKFSAVDSDLLHVLRCYSAAAVSGKLVKLWHQGLVERSLPDKKSPGKPAYMYQVK